MLNATTSTGNDKRELRPIACNHQPLYQLQLDVEQAATAPAFKLVGLEKLLVFVPVYHAGSFKIMSNVDRLTASDAPSATAPLAIDATIKSVPDPLVFTNAIFAALPPEAFVTAIFFMSLESLVRASILRPESEPLEYAAGPVKLPLFSAMLPTSSTLEASRTWASLAFVLM